MYMPLFPELALIRVTGRLMPSFMSALDCSAYYLKFDIKDYKYSKSKFEISIGDNYFSNKEIRLNIKNKGLQLEGELSFKNIVPYPKTISRPGIMGPYSYIPFMECYHGIVNIHHDIEGSMNICCKAVDFSKGYGYIEKDWGSSFPEAWIWLQSNHFKNDDVSVMFSTAKIPWLGKYFIGFISFLRIKQKIYVFATYNKAKITDISYKDNKLKVSIRHRHNSLEIEAEHSRGGLLKAPKNGLMSREILESISAVVKVCLRDTDGKIIFEGEGTHAGLEIVEDIFDYYFNIFRNPSTKPSL